MRASRFLRVAVAAGAVVTVSGTVAGNSSASADLEDELIILCTPQEAWCEVVREAFEAETGISTQYQRLSAGEAIARLEAEGDNPSFDVWFGGPSVGPVAAASRGDFIEPYISENAAMIPDELKDADGLWTGIYVGALGFCSNAELVADLGVDAPDSYEALLDPVFENNIAVADMRTSGTAATLAANLVAVLGDEDAAIDYLKQLDSNIFQYTRSGAAPGNMAAQSEVAVALIFSHDCVAIAEETGVDLTLTFPSEGTGFEIGQISLINHAQHPNAAKAFIDWALTAPTQELAATAKSYQIPTNPDAAIPEQSVSLDEILLHPDYSPQLAEDLRAGEFVNRWADEVRGGAEAPS